MGHDESSRHIYQALECLMKTSESVAALFQELSKSLAETTDTSPAFTFVDSYGYSSSLLSVPQNWFREYQGCIFVPRAEGAEAEQGTLKRLRAGDLVLTAVAQFYSPRAITQAEVWFGVCRLNSDPREWASLVYTVTPEYMKHWKSKALPDYGKWASNSVKRSDNPDMALEWSRQPLGAFTSREVVRALLAEPLRDKFVAMDKRRP